MVSNVNSNRTVSTPVRQLQPKIKCDEVTTSVTTMKPHESANRVKKGIVRISAESLKTYPEDKVEEKEQELHALHSSLHSALNLESEKGNNSSTRCVNPKHVRCVAFL